MEEEPEVVCSDPNFDVDLSYTGEYNNGFWTIRLSGGTWYSFEWSNGAAGAYQNNLQPDLYQVTIINDENCSVTKNLDLRIEEPEGYKIGDLGPAGGIIFYLDDNGGGLEVAPASTVWNNKTWGCSGSTINTSENFGKGQTNTNLILSNCGEANIAARLADNLTYNDYSDWFLPSYEELMILEGAIYTYEISGYPSGNYWSSSEIISTSAYVRDFSSGGSVQAKNSGQNVVAIRKF